MKEKSMVADKNFFQKSGLFSLKDIQNLLGGELVIAEHMSEDTILEDLSSIDEAGQKEICFLQNTKYKKKLPTCGAGLILLSKENAPDAPKSSSLLICEDPYYSWGQLTVAFYPFEQRKPEIHETAVISPTAKIADTAYIGPHVVIEDHVVIGDYTQIHGGCFVGAAVQIGSKSVLYPHVSVTHTIMGHMVVLHSGVRIGQDGFGFAMSAKGHQYVRQFGRVMIGNDVNIGANTTVDRGAGPDTIIEDGVRIDNLVQIAHNVHISQGSVIVAQAGIAGSTRLGKGVVLGGQTAVAGHLTLHDGAMLTAQSGTDKDIPKGEVWASSIPAIAVKTHWRRVAMFNRLLKSKK